MPFIRSLCKSYCVSVTTVSNHYLKILLHISLEVVNVKRDFTTIQDVVQAVNHRIPKLAQTRWLSRENVVSRILEQWKVLVLYFQSESRNDKVDGASKIYKLLVARGTKHMLCFLQYVLSKVNALNLEFQSEQFGLHKLHSMVSTEYKIILSFSLKKRCSRKWIEQY